MARILFELSAEQYFELGVSHYQEKQYDLSLKYFTKAIDLGIETAQAYYNRGLILLNYNMYNEALLDLTKSLQLDPKNDHYLDTRGIIYHNITNFKLALVDFNKAIDLNPNNVSAYNDRALTYRDSKDFDLSIADYTKAIELDPTLDILYYNRAVVYGLINQYTLAILDYSKTIVLNPLLIDAYYNRAIAYSKQELLSLAIADYTQIINLDSKQFESYNNRGILYKRLNQFDQALYDLTEALNLYPIHTFYFNRSSIYLLIGQVNEAINDLEIAISLEPRASEAYNALGIIYFNLAHQEIAIFNFTKFIELDKNNANGYYNRGKALYENNQLIEAMNDFSKAIEIDSSLSLAFYYKGRINYDMKQFDLALTQYNITIQLNPSFAGAYNGLGMIYEDKGWLTEAMEEYTKAIKIAPNDAIAYNNRGLLAKNQFLFDQAIHDFTKAIEVEPNDAIALSNRGMSYRQMNKLNLALDDLNKSIEIDNNFISPYFNRGLVHFDNHSFLMADNDYVRCTYLINLNSIDLKTVETILKVILPFFRDFSLRPYLTKYLLVNYKIQQLFSYANLISQNQAQCVVMDRYILYLRKIRMIEYYHPAKFYTLEAIIHFYMGNPEQTFKLFDEVIDVDHKIDLRGQYYFIRSASALQLAHTSQNYIVQSALDQCEDLFNSFHINDASGSQIEELYYAGLIYFIVEDFEKSHRCFSRIFLQFPAAAYMQIFTLEKLGRWSEAIVKIERIRKWEASDPINGFLRGFNTQEINFEVSDFSKLIFDFSLHHELLEALQLVKGQDDYNSNSPALWDAFTISDVNFHKSKLLILEKELADILEKNKRLFNVTCSLEEQLDWGADPEVIFDRLKSSTSFQIEEDLVKLIGVKRLRYQELNFFIRYFYFNNNLNLWQTFTLFIFLQSSFKGKKSHHQVIQEVGSKTIEEFIKQLLQDPATYITAGAFSLEASSREGNVSVSVLTTTLAGFSIYILARVAREFNLASVDITNSTILKEYKYLKINFIDQLNDVSHELSLDGRKLFNQYIKPVLDKELIFNNI